MFYVYEGIRVRVSSQNSGMKCLVSNVAFLMDTNGHIALYVDSSCVSVYRSVFEVTEGRGTPCHGNFFLCLSGKVKCLFGEWKCMHFVTINYPAPEHSHSMMN
jgi:hypothetical protein